MIRIDGSYGEGGGQILRTSLALAAVLQKPIEIFNIRIKRPKPGLRPQHFACVKAVQKITHAEVEEVKLGTKRLIFYPKGIYPGHYTFDIGTAGSISLLLQGILLPLVMADSPSEVVVRGGTHVPFSPPYHYLEYVLAPMLLSLGIKLDFRLFKWGWYPEGGGEITVKVFPVKKFKGQYWEKPPNFSSLKVISASSHLPEDIRKRQTKKLLSYLREVKLKAEIEEIEASAKGKGTFLFLWVDEVIKAGFSALGAKGKPAEKVAKEVFKKFLFYYKKRVCVDEHLADQIVPFLALASGKSFFITIISSHLITNIWVINQFLKRKIEYKGDIGKPGILKIT
ncbi:MAG TPA: RNA 3'-phosphate cyclase [Candidatus Desulfofervidus auxilii]|uniref:RNA 3'-terminal phosphate cyclase n=1 Tax=Desulfofervidus auxilii TaxID=1621989 RepID=A0A7V0I9W5_DESA2|nr:RNA 3'-phosphate cyclase [Candidatus Desulfofervidus auxilii]